MRRNGVVETRFYICVLYFSILETELLKHVFIYVYCTLVY